MQKTRFISILAAGLLLSNIALVAYIFWGHMGHNPPPRQGHEGPRDIIIERLQFSDAQVAQYDKLIQQHRRAVNESDEQLVALKNALYATLTGLDVHAQDSLINAITQAQRDMEYVHYRHFEDIKKLCTPQQLTDFNALAADLASLFGPPRHKPH